MFTVEHYTIIAEWFPRLLGLIYFFAFGAFIFQIRGLIGSNGILPVAEYLSLLGTYYPKQKYKIAPSLFWLNSGNAALMTITIAGTLLSLMLVFGFLPPLMLFLLYFLYLSIVSTGQTFLSFGWEGYLLEITVNAFFLSLVSVPNIMVWLSINFLLFRFHFQAGTVKLQSRDASWANYTALTYHYLTQPLPNTVAWYMDKLPLWFQKFSCGFVFFTELIVPFGIFYSENVRLITFVLLLGLQFFIWVSGNYSFLNHLTAVFCTLLLNDSILTSLFGIHVDVVPTNLGMDIFPSTVCGTILWPFKWFDFGKAICLPISSTIFCINYPIFI